MDQAELQTDRIDWFEAGRKAERLAIAHTMKQHGLPVAQIAQMTGLSEAEVLANQKSAEAQI